MIVLPQSFKLALLEELIDTGNLLDGAKVGLYQNNIVLGPGTVLADLTVADFTGYALSAAVVWGTPFVDAANKCIVTADEKEFLATSPFTTSNTVYGYYIVDGAGTTLLYAEAFTTPRQITAAFQGLTVLPRFDCLSSNA